MSLLGLVRHMTDVERGWFRWGLAGEQVPDVYDRTDDEDADFAVAEADAKAAFDSFVAELAAVRAVAARHGLDDTFVRQDNGVEISLRWVLRAHDRGVRAAQRARRPDPRTGRRRDG